MSEARPHGTGQQGNMSRELAVRALDRALRLALRLYLLARYGRRPSAPTGAHQPTVKE